MAEPTTPGARRTLTADAVLRAAVELADREGLDAVSMRRLAEALDAGAMSLYHHVPGKDALLDGMVDVVFAEIDAPALDGDWKGALRQRAISTRAALKRHPWAVGVMESRATPGPASLRLHDAVLGCLRRAGFSIADAVHAYSVQDAYIYGHALQEKGFSFQTGEEAARSGERMLRQFEHRAEELPHLIEVVGQYVARGGYDPTREFEFGLDLLLDALERLLAGSREQV